MTDIEQTIPSRLAARATETPFEAAHTVHRRGSLTYQEWLSRSAATARGLSDHGLGTGSRLLIPCQQVAPLDVPVLYMAIMSVGGVAILVADDLPEPTLTDLARHLHASMVGYGSLSGHTARSLGEGQPRRQLSAVVYPDDVAEIVVTSDPTGAPTTVQATHENLLAKHHPARVDRTRRTLLHGLPYGREGTQGLLISPLDGAPHRVVSVPAFSTDVLAAAIRDWRPTHITLTPSQARILIDGLPSISNSGVDVVRVVAGHIEPEEAASLQRLFEGCEVRVIYTRARAWPATLSMSYDVARPGAVGHVGDPPRARVVNDGVPVADGERGDIELSVAGQPARQTVDGEPIGPWVRMGDVGYVDRDGVLIVEERAETHPTDS